MGIEISQVFRLEQLIRDITGSGIVHLSEYTGNKDLFGVFFDDRDGRTQVQTETTQLRGHNLDSEEDIGSLTIETGQICDGADYGGLLLDTRVPARINGAVLNPSVAKWLVVVPQEGKTIVEERFHKRGWWKYPSDLPVLLPRSKVIVPEDYILKVGNGDYSDIGGVVRYLNENSSYKFSVRVSGGLGGQLSKNIERVGQRVIGNSLKGKERYFLMIEIEGINYVIGEINIKKLRMKDGISYERWELEIDRSSIGIDLANGSALHPGECMHLEFYRGPGNANPKVYRSGTIKSRTIPTIAAISPLYIIEDNKLLRKGMRSQ